MQTLNQILNGCNGVENGNTPHTSSEMQEWKQSLHGTKGHLPSIGLNRSERRKKEQSRGIRNNRKNPNKRLNVWYKMAAFAMDIQDKKLQRA